MNYWLLLIPFLSAILGWLGMWVGCKLFLYRIIPSRQQVLAESIGKTVSAAFPLAAVEKKIIDPENIKKVMPIVEAHVDDFLRNKLKEKMPVIGMFIGDKTINSLKEVFLKEIEDLFPQVLKQFTGNLRGQLDIETMVTNKITSVSSRQMEKMVSPALRYFHLTGAITGFIIGIIDLLFFYL